MSSRKHQFWVSLGLLTSLGAADRGAETDMPLPPEEAARTMRVPEGFEVTLFAGEPDVKQPIACCVDDRGRVWVAEAYSYPDHGDEPRGDRILILEDRDGDGRFDERKVFYDQLNYVSGIEVGFGGVWVMSPPYFFFLPDRDGDDVPDSEPKVILDGFGNHANAHNMANGFAWGPDGWLYGTHGRTNWSLLGKPGAPEEDRVRFDGGVWRYHPVEDRWEPYADGCTNPWGIDWDDYGEAFIPNTVNPHLFHVIQGAHYEPWRNRESSRFAYQRIETIADHLHFLGEKNVREGLGSEEELALGGGHSHCGILVYLGDSWPQKYRNTVFLHNTHGRRINHDILARSGSGYTASHGRDFLIAEDPWLMGVSFQASPDGSVYVTDWSDTGECHSVRNTRRNTGRIYRISYGKPKFEPVDMAALTSEELVQRQLHRNDWHVRHARRVLHERAAGGADLSGVHGQLHAMLEENPDSTRKLRALWALFVSGGLDKGTLTDLLDHDEETLRAWAVKLLSEDRDPPEVAYLKMVSLAREGDAPLVRLHLASLLQRLEPGRRWELAQALAARSEDREDQNLPLMIWYGIEPLVHEDVARFAGLISQTQIPLLQRHIARRVASLPRPEEGLAEVLSSLEGGEGEMVMEVLQGIRTGLEGRNDARAPRNWKETVKNLGQNPRTRLPVLEIGAIFRDPGTLDELRSLAEDFAAPVPERRAAVKCLVGARPDGLDAWLLDQLDDSVLRRSALRGLAVTSNPATADRILERYPGFPAGETRQDALQSLASRLEWARSLLDAVEIGWIPREELTAYTTRQIVSLGDSGLETRVAEIWGEVRSTPAAKRRKIDRLVRDLPDRLNRADHSQGRVLYQQLCSACHELFGEGGHLGPNLTGAQRSSLEYLLENTMDPSGSVARDYQMQIFELDDGRTLTGFLSGESETTVTIRSVNEELVLPRGSIRNRVSSPVSMMPEGLLDSLSDRQMEDLIAYLMSPVQVPLASGKED